MIPRVIGSVKHEISVCTKILRNWSEKLEAKMIP